MTDQEALVCVQILSPISFGFQLAKVMPVLEYHTENTRHDTPSLQSISPVSISSNLSDSKTCAHLVHQSLTRRTAKFLFWSPWLSTFHLLMYLQQSVFFFSLVAHSLPVDQQEMHISIKTFMIL